VGKVILLVGRILLALIFLYSGYHKLADPAVPTARLVAKDVPLADVLVLTAGIVEILGGLMMGLGYRLRLGAFLLIVFLIPTTLILHPPTDAGQTTQFLKNLAILGGLLVVIGADAAELDD
jgi:putative oxidoreductase